MATLLGQWESDIDRMKESEEKLTVSLGLVMKLYLELKVVY